MIGSFGKLCNAIVIVNYNTAALTINCLQSLYGNLSENDMLHVDLVDNASPDNSIEVLDRFLNASGFDSVVKLIAAPRNGGVFQKFQNHYSQNDAR
jgi:hypothetical protein